MKNPFKAIYNFFFPEKKKPQIEIVVDIEKPVKQLKELKRVTNELIGIIYEPTDISRDCYFISTGEIDDYITKPLTKNQFRQLALSHGYEARYSGKEKFFYLHKTLSN